MGLFSEVKCPRCDRRYSGMRTRCPYCGARRNKKGKRAANPDNATWKMVVAILLIVILIAAVVVLILTASSGEKEEAKVEASPTPTYSADEGVDSVEASPTATPTATPSPTAPAVTSITLTYLGDALPSSEGTDYDYDVTMSVGEALQLEYTTEPANSTATAEWKSADESIAAVLSNGQITAIASGTTVVTLTVGGTSVTCNVRVG